MGNSLAGQWLGLGAFTTVAWVQPLVRELISYKSWVIADQRKKEKKSDTWEIHFEILSFSTI